MGPRADREVLRRCAISGRAPCGNARGPRDGFRNVPGERVRGALGRFGLSLEDERRGVGGGDKGGGRVGAAGSERCRRRGW